ncbi:MAG: glycosyltransferase family 2 protein [Flavobacteriales bacterium]|nr:glycosyltransferase family 2 protein [Flavobacteriales bacterium]
MRNRLEAKNSKTPLISLLVYNYEPLYLRSCLESIFSQTIITEYEVVLIDDHTHDGSWEIALDFLSKHPEKISVQRNRASLGALNNRRAASELAKGQYFICLEKDSKFYAEYFNSVIDTMITDPRVENAHVFREDSSVLKQTHSTATSNNDEPLVSILCYNYNYGKYLKESLESCFSQTYKNIEVCFSDNASTDDSWDIALKLEQKYSGKITIIRNRQNFGPDNNYFNCWNARQGKFYVNYCSDDVLAPRFVEYCVNVMKKNDNVGLTIVNRAIIDEDGNRTEEAPFYNKSCIIPGNEQAAVYMMAGINPSVSQIMYRDLSVSGIRITGGLAARYYGTRIRDFTFSLVSDIAFIKEPLLLNREHGQTDSTRAEKSLLPVIGMYVLNHQFADLASHKSLTNVTDRLPNSIEKLSTQATRYCLRFLNLKDETTAQKYFYLAVAMDPSIKEDETWLKVKEYWDATEERKIEIMNELKSQETIDTRTISYAPPEGSIQFDVKTGIKEQ